MLQRRAPAEGAAAGRSVIQRSQDRLDKMGSLQTFLLIFLAFAVVYVPTTSLLVSQVDSSDTYTNGLTARNVATERSFVLRDYADQARPELEGYVSWIVDGADGPVSQYPPGAALHAVPFYLLAPGTISEEPLRVELQDGTSVDISVKRPQAWQASIAAALVVACAMGLLALVLRQFDRTSLVLPAVLVAGLGTGAWSVAADELWQHGPGMAWIAASMWCTSRRWPVPTASAWAMCVLIRPPLALIALGVAVMLVISERSLRRAVPVVAGVGLGAGLLMAFNQMMFGAPSLSGGYRDTMRSGLTEFNPGWYAGNLMRALLDPGRGLLVWAPFLALLAVGVTAGWKAAPPWVRGSALGALGYALFQYKANRYTGGAGYPGYRYPLEPLMAAAPLLYLSWRERLRDDPVLARATKGTAGVAVALQGVMAVLW